MITKDRSNWMHEHRDILNDKFLASICLPGNHDSPTAKLQNIATDERRKDDRLLNLNKIPFGLAEHGYIAAKLMATATTKDIATQLNDGLRAFDFRVFEQMFDESYVIAPGGAIKIHVPEHYAFYSVHSLLGESYEEPGDIFDQLTAFLSSRKGEILYLSFLFLKTPTTADTRARFAALLKQKLGAYAIPVNNEVSPKRIIFSSVIRLILGNPALCEIVLLPNEPVSQCLR